jgi:lysophospholipase L1-like esterase
MAMTAPPGEGATDGEVVMLGDSITADGPWHELFPGRAVRNFGIPGDSTTGVLWRLDEVIAHGPAKVFVLIGTNDLMAGTADERIQEDLVTIAARLQQRCPAAEVLVQSILPREPFWAERIKRINAIVGPQVRRCGARWIDLWPAFADDAGGLRRGYTTDGLHLSPAGYRAWAAEIRPFVEVG